MGPWFEVQDSPLSTEFFSATEARGRGQRQGVDRLPTVRGRCGLTGGGFLERERKAESSDVSRLFLWCDDWSWGIEISLLLYYIDLGVVLCPYP